MFNNTGSTLHVLQPNLNSKFISLKGKLWHKGNTKPCAIVKQIHLTNHSLTTKLGSDFEKCEIKENTGSQTKARRKSHNFSLIKGFFF